jgi:cell division protein FtsX
MTAPTVSIGERLPDLPGSVIADLRAVLAVAIACLIPVVRTRR